MPEQLSWLLFHVTGTLPWLLKPAKVSTNSELYYDYFPLPTFLECSGIHFFNSPLTRPVRLHLATCHSLYSSSVTHRTTCHASGHLMLPTHSLPRKAEDFPRGDKHPKHMYLLTYLICFSQKGYYMVGSI